MPRNPKTPQEWQDAVDTAEALLLIDSARQYGLVVGGPKVRVERCVEILRKGRGLGYKPVENCLRRIL